MALLYLLADMFINTFGITQPTPRKRKQAAFFILGLMALVIAGAVTSFIVIHASMK
jgi:hypothetical protein